MVQKVVPNRMVAHLWANQSQSDARTSNGNYWFEGPDLYSYRTLIGHITVGIDGERIALLSSRSYSVTTAGKHIGPASRAVSYRDFRVPEPNVRDPAAHVKNLAHCLARYDDAKAKALRAPYSEFRASYVSRDLPDALAEAIRYAKAFDLAAPTRDIVADLATINARFERLRAAKETPAYLAKQAQIKAAREAAEAEQLRLERLSADEKRAAWLSGVSVNLPYSYSRLADLPVLLRVKGATLETSLGASVPLAHAIRVFHAVKRCKELGQSWERNGHTLHVGQFQVDRIEATGDFKAGCHAIKWDEVERIARLVGVFDDVKVEG